MKCPKCNDSGMYCTLCGGSGYVDSNNENVRQYLDWKRNNPSGGNGCMITLLVMAGGLLSTVYGVIELFV